jgi:hypothetical protein
MLRVVRTCSCRLKIGRRRRWRRYGVAIDVGADDKERLLALYRTLDPVVLRIDIRAEQAELWKFESLIGGGSFLRQPEHHFRPGDRMARRRDLANSSAALRANETSVSEAENF